MKEQELSEPSPTKRPSLRERLKAKRIEERQIEEHVIFESPTIMTSQQISRTKKSIDSLDLSPKQREMKYGDLPPGLKSVGFVPLSSNVPESLVSKILENEQSMKYCVEIYGVIYIKDADIDEALIQIGEQKLSRNQKKPERREPLREETFHSLFTRIPETAVHLLSPHEYAIFSDAHSGVPIHEIAKKYNLPNRNAASRILSSARKKIQNELLHPKGVKKIASFKDQGLLDAAAKNVITAVKFLGEYYTTDYFADHYFSHRTRRVDPGMIQNGYRLLQDILSPEEYEKAREKRTKFAPYLTRHKKRIYVAPEHIDKVLSLAAGEKPPRKEIKVTQYPEYVTLRSTANDEKEYGRLKIAARKGRIKTIKTNYATLVLPQDIEDWRNRTS